MPVSKNLNAVLNYERKLLDENKILMLKKGKLITKQVKFKTEFTARLMLEINRYMNVPVFNFTKVLLKDEIPHSAIMSEQPIEKSLDVLEKMKRVLESKDPEKVAFVKANGMTSKSLNHLKGQITFIKSLLTEKDGYTSYHIEHMKNVLVDEKGMFVAVSEQPDGYIVKVMTRKDSISFAVNKTEYMDFDLGFTIGKLISYFPYYRR